MKVIQSFWSKPFLAESMIEGRYNGGWLEKKYYYMSISLSCLLLHRLYSKVELVTDKAGADILVNKLKLPYTHVEIVLDTLNDNHPGLWAIGKLYTYSLQNTAFIHVDNDVFIWEKFPETIHKASLVAQSLESEHSPIYKTGLEYLYKYFDYIPFYFNQQEVTIYSVNAGILGGSNIDFIKKYSTSMLDFLRTNKVNTQNNDSPGVINTVVEQYSFFKLAQIEKIQIEYAIPKVGYNYNEVINFNKVPFESKFIHLVGKAKKNFYSCEQVEHRLRYEFPEEYSIISKMIESMSNLSLKSNEAEIIKKVDENTKKAFSILEKYIDYSCEGKIDFEYARNKLDDMAASLNNNLAILLGQLINLEEAKSLLENLKNVKEARYETISSAYEFFRIASKNDIMNISLTMTDSCIVQELNWEPSYIYNIIDEDIANIDNKNTFYVCIHNNSRQVIVSKLNSWERLLAYFQGNQCCGKDLLNLFLSGNDDQKQIDKTKDFILEFITSNLIYTATLKIA